MSIYLHLNGPKYAAILSDIRLHLRNRLKYAADLTDDEQDVYESLRDFINETVQEKLHEEI